MNEKLRHIMAATLCLLPAVIHGQFAYWPVSVGGNGHCYEAVASASISWYEANDVATQKGGYLATITSPEENAFVYALIKTNAALWEPRLTGNCWGPWIGGMQIPGSIEPAGGWAWANGEPFGYANWNAGEPSNDHGIEDRIHFWGQQAAVGDVWNDRPATNSVRGFVIEYDVHPNAVWLSISFLSRDTLQITWASRPDVGYTVQWAGAFASTDWNTLTNVVGTGSTCSVYDLISQSQRFYRVVSSP